MILILAHDMPNENQRKFNLNLFILKKNCLNFYQ